MNRTIAISNPCKLSSRLKQLILTREGKVIGQVPFEDLGVLILEHPQIQLTHSVLALAMEHNVAVISCDPNYHPSGMHLSLNSHYLQRKLFEAQLMASEPLKKQLWQTIVKAKLTNQARLLEALGKPGNYIFEQARKVRSGDADNIEAQVASYYWRHLFDKPIQRQRGAGPPNAYLNYGYAILRAMTARALAVAGLLCTWGIHHRNQYNAFCLADDLMEVYRPWVDRRAVQLMKQTPQEVLTKEDKIVFLEMAGWDVETSLGMRPLQHALAKSASSLQKSFTEKKNVLELGHDLFET